MSVPYEEYEQWKSSGVFTELVKDIQESMSNSASEIVTRSVPNTDRDQYLRGFIAGLGTLFSWKPTFTVEQTEETEDD